MTTPQITEAQGILKKSGQVTLNAQGIGELFFDPDNARQRWEVTSVVVKTDQAANATVTPVATLAINTSDITVLSDGNNRGQSWSGNQDTFQGQVDIGPADFLTVAFSPPPGATPAQVTALAGVIASAVVTGTKYTRRS